jgi:hypothetical protein
MDTHAHAASVGCQADELMLPRSMCLHRLDTHAHTASIARHGDGCTLLLYRLYYPVHSHAHAAILNVKVVTSSSCRTGTSVHRALPR